MSRGAFFRSWIKSFIKKPNVFKIFSITKLSITLSSTHKKPWFVEDLSVLSSINKGDTGSIWTNLWQSSQVAFYGFAEYE